jgi:mRNA-degrading endonuclease RelE of RelBE toxin-antitoxin system
MAWTVQWKRKIEKQLEELPEKVQVSFRALVQEIEIAGPVCRYP